ncbi:hypothetical protein MASR1M8_03320 [Thermomonas brevis]
MVRFPTESPLELSMSAVLQDRSTLDPATLTATAPGQDALLTPAALAFLADLHRRFEDARQERLAARKARQAQFDAGALPDFRADTAHIRGGDWKVAPAPAALADRRVEITGPVDPKMVINALNSGANCYMADFEDSTSPTWGNLVEGQLALREAVAGTLQFAAPGVDGKPGKQYALKPEAERAVLIVRPRGWHLDEKHVLVDGQRMSGGLFDAGLFAFHNGAALAAKGRGPYLYLPKLQCMEEAALWEQALAAIEAALGLPHGQIKVTVLIETLPAAFEMDEILHALKDRIVGLNCGRWDYIFSFIKTFRRHADRVLPERSQVTMTQPFLRAYSELLIKTCHRRGAHAMGGMAAQIPITGDAAGQRRRAGARARRQAARGHRRPRRHLGGASGADPGGARDVRRAHARGQPAARGPRRRQRQPRRAHHARCWARSPAPASRTTSRSACATWPRGWTATAACRSTG